MPFTSKGIYYPGPKFPPQISEDMSQMGSLAFQSIEYMQATRVNGPETITAPTSYTSAVGAGNGDSVDFNFPSNSSGQSGLLWFNYIGQWKKTTTATLNAAIVLSINGGTLTQLKRVSNGGAPVVIEASDTTAYTAPGFYGILACDRTGLNGPAAGTADATLNAANGFRMPEGCLIWGSANSGFSVHIEVKYKASAGNVVLGARNIFAGTIKAK